LIFSIKIRQEKIRHDKIMNNSFMSRVRQFISDTIAELHKCTWPGKSELFESTILVIVAIVILSCFVALVDQVGRIVINFITGTL
jgi:preprotein translocase subunit SecE